MKTACIVFLACFVLPAFGADKENKAVPKKTSRSTVPAKYPSIIQLPVTPEEVIEEGKKPSLITTDLGGLELHFFKAANESGAQLLALTNLAKSKASSDEIKTVSETMAKAQVDENARVAELASRKGVSLGATFPTKLAEEFAPLWGAKFDKSWMERLVVVNKDAVAAYETGVAVEDGEIKGFAEKMLPIVQAKLQLANRLAGVSTSSPSGTTAAVAVTKAVESKSAATPAPDATKPLSKVTAPGAPEPVPSVPKAAPPATTARPAGKRSSATPSATRPKPAEAE